MRGIIERPEGFSYQADFISPEEEVTLLQFVRSIDYGAVVMHGVKAKRVTRHYGYNYNYESRKVIRGEAIPSEIEPIRRRAESFAGLAKGALKELLITKYPYGAPIGWHRDAPSFGDSVIGLSLLSPCVMQFERREGDKRFVYERVLNPRSAYIISGAARYVWLHHIPPTKSERYSLTFRTLK